MSAFKSNQPTNRLISVIIATKNRPSDIKRCLASIEKNVYASYEVIVVDQSNAPQPIHTTDYPRIPKLHYIMKQQKGKATALNCAIAVSNGDLLAFTDDDCIVSKRWLSRINTAASKHPACVAFFGTTRPYQPTKHKGLYCPATFNQPAPTIVSEPCAHYRYIGFGNNMVITKSAIQTFGQFKTWLGPGSIGSNAEDAEMALRLLLNNNHISYEPQMVVYHNRWLTTTQVHAITRSYTCGEFACYGYFYIQGYSFALPILKSALITEINQLFSGRDILHKFLNSVSGGWGILVAMYYAILDPVHHIRSFH